MKIQDAIARAIYREVLACPGNFPPELFTMGEIVRDFRHVYAGDDDQNKNSPSWASFKEYIAQYGVCTENE